MGRYLVTAGSFVGVAALLFTAHAAIIEATGDPVLDWVAEPLTFILLGSLAMIGLGVVFRAARRAR